MRLCVIGPSHLASLREARNENLVDPGNVEVIYMGHRWGIYKFLGYADGELCFRPPRKFRPISPQIMTSVTPAEFDALFFHGTLDRPSELFASGTANDMLSGRYSQSMIENMVRTRIGRWPGMGILRRLRKDFEGPILLSCKPERVPEAGQDIAEGGEDDMARKQQLIGAALEDLGITFVRQPEETVLGGLWTRPEYGTGAVKMNEVEAYDADDRQHMNARYGAIVFNQVLRMLSDTPVEGSDAAPAK